LIIRTCHRKVLLLHRSFGCVTENYSCFIHNYGLSYKLLLLHRSLGCSLEKYCCIIGGYFIEKYCCFIDHLGKTKQSLLIHRWQGCFVENYCHFIVGCVNIKCYCFIYHFVCNKKRIVTSLINRISQKSAVAWYKFNQGTWCEITVAFKITGLCHIKVLLLHISLGYVIAKVNKNIFHSWTDEIEQVGFT